MTKKSRDIKDEPREHSEYTGQYDNDFSSLNAGKNALIAIAIALVLGNLIIWYHF